MINERVQQTCREIMNIIKKVHRKQAAFQTCVHQNKADVFAAPSGCTEYYSHICPTTGSHIQQELVENKNLHADPVNQR